MAKDGEDIAIVSGLVQDSLFPISDTRYDKSTQTFAIVLNRFCWEQAFDKPPYIRTHSILHFSNVTAVSSHDIDKSAGRIYDILSLIPSQNEKGQFVHLTLAGGSVIRLKINAMQVTLKDVGDAWKSTSRPVHENADLQE